ncbi:MAG: radical SAM protein [Deltaproteobacteria bacterium]|nr:radical SAM protein [Deltaproteobacteria bacterium]
MTQVNTPYPATAYLTGFLRSRGYETYQADPALELVLKLLSPAGLSEISQELKRKFPTPNLPTPKSVRHFLKFEEDYLTTIESVIRFLQNQDPTLAYRIVTHNYLPEGPRFKSLEELNFFGDDGLQWAFGSLGLQDRAKHLASLYIDDLADMIRDGIDSRFEFSRYGEKLAASAASFEPMEEALRAKPTLVDRSLDELAEKYISHWAPDVLALTVPFPGNLYGALRIGKKFKELSPTTKIILGGGYVNTELRQLSEVKIFDYVDFITLDDGERPILTLLENLSQSHTLPKYLRTFLKEKDKVVFKNDPSLHDIPFIEAGIPTYDGLPLDRYLSLCELLNPMHRLWSDGRWNKLTLAHGCYWKKCSFCDTSLDYIGRYEPAGAKLLVDRIEQLVRETGQTGFHFVDEAAPPKTLAALAQELIRRKLNISWWTNIRFEKTFNLELTQLMAQSGCIAVSGGLEVASNRLLALMKKGVTVEQVAQVTHHFSQSGIMVHAYLMYGFPSQTLQETIDSLERVRQLFQQGCIQSAFWHRFSATIHSPVGKNPEDYGIILTSQSSNFANNDLSFKDPQGEDPSSLAPGLKKAVYNYMHGLGVDDDIKQWFEFKIPKPKVASTLIQQAIHASKPTKIQTQSLC